MSWEATLQTNWRCAGGIPIADLGIVGSDSLLTRRLDGRHGISLSLDRDYYDLCRRRNAVVMLTAEDGLWWEFRNDGLVKGARDSHFTLTGLPPWYDLETADFVRETIGGRSILSFTESVTMTELIAGRILTNTVEDGLDWIDIGTVDFDDRMDLEWSRLKRAGLLQLGLQSLKRGEMELVPDGFTRYVLNVVTAIGAGGPLIPARFGDRLREAQRTTEFGPLYTSVRVVGEVPSSDMEPTSFGENVYRVQSVTAIGPGGIGPYAVVLRDPATDVSPIQLDGLFAVDPEGTVDACWLQLPTGNATEILDARAATGDVVVAIAPSVDERVSIVASADGVALDRLTWPYAVGRHGVVVADARVPGGRGERNYIVNPGFDGTASEYSAAVGADITLLPRTQVVPLVGAKAGTRAPGAPASFAVDGFVPGEVAKRGDTCEVEGVQFVTVGDVFVDETGDATLPLTTTLPATIPAGTQLRGDTVAYLLARGAANLIGDSDLDITLPGATTRPWQANDELTLTISIPETQTLSGATERDRQFVTLVLASPFTRDIPLGAFVAWTHGAATRLIQLSQAYTSGGPSIEIRHPTWTPHAQLRGEVQPFGLAGETLTHVLVVTSTHVVTNSPTWNTSAQATVIISPALPVAAPIAQTAIRWDRTGASAFVGALQLVADQAASATTFLVYGPGLVTVIPDGTILSLVGESFTITTDATFDGAGAATLVVTFAPTTTLLDNSVVRLWRNTEWAPDDGGGENVALIEGVMVVDENAPAIGDAAVQTQPFRVTLPPGASAQVIARVEWTGFASERTNAVAKYAAAKIALVDLDTNTVVAWAASAPENADTLTAPANARLPLTWDLATREWLPLHFSLACDVLITATTQFELRMYGPFWSPGQPYGRSYARFSSVWVAGPTDSIPFVHGARANDLLLTGVQLLARNAQPADTFTVELDAFDAAVAAAAGLPSVACPPIDIGTRLLLEDDQVELRVLDVERTPDRRISQVTVGRQPPTATLTLAALAVVSSVGGTR